MRLLIYIDFVFLFVRYFSNISQQENVFLSDILNFFFQNIHCYSSAFLHSFSFVLNSILYTIGTESYCKWSFLYMRIQLIPVPMTVHVIKLYRPFIGLYDNPYYFTITLT